MSPVLVFRAFSPVRYNQNVTYFILAVFGLAIGSFVNVLALRYDGEHFVLDPKIVGGRSHCPYCKRTLRWFELIPLLSFLLQRGRCRTCKAAISARYPLMEILSGAIFVFVPWHLASYPWLTGAAGDAGLAVFSAIWIAAFELLLLMAAIDLRLQIIPDEVNVMFGMLAILEAIFAGAYLGPDRQSFFGAYAALFGLAGNLWLAHAVGAVVGAGFLGFLALITRGKGMGMGDVKLALPLGFIFGWPDMVFLLGFSFVIGAVAGIFAIAAGRKTMKMAIPFGPFLALASAIVFFFGSRLLDGYLALLW